MHVTFRFHMPARNLKRSIFTGTELLIICFGRRLFVGVCPRSFIHCRLASACLADTDNRFENASMNIARTLMLSRARFDVKPQSAVFSLRRREQLEWTRDFQGRGSVKSSKKPAFVSAKGWKRSESSRPPRILRAALS